MMFVTFSNPIIIPLRYRKETKAGRPHSHSSPWETLGHPLHFWESVSGFGLMQLRRPTMPRCWNSSSDRLDLPPCPLHRQSALHEDSLCPWEIWSGPGNDSSRFLSTREGAGRYRACLSAPGSDRGPGTSRSSTRFLCLLRAVEHSQTLLRSIYLRSEVVSVPGSGHRESGVVPSPDGCDGIGSQRYIALRASSGRLDSGG